VMQRARSRWSADVIVSTGIAVFGLTTIAAGALQALVPLGAVILVGGAAWTSFTSLFNVQVLNQTPDWVRARVLAVSMLVVQGAVAAGSAALGRGSIKNRPWQDAFVGRCRNNPVNNPGIRSAPA
jgi:transmembrane secretion effector